MHITRLCANALLPLLLGSLAVAQSPKSPPIHGLAHVAIRVNDIAASRAFYEKLGFQQAFDMEKNGVVTQSFIKVNDRQFIELYPKTAADPAIGFLHLCFDGDDLAALHDFNVAQGLPPLPLRKAGAGNMLFTMRGPEDENIEYTQYLPGSLHYEDRGKHLGADRIADNFFAVALPMKDVAAARDFYTGKLGFSTAPGHPDLLVIPGSSEQILVGPYTPVSRIFLFVPNLAKTGAELKRRGVGVKSSGHRLTVTDPDGNELVLTSERSAA
jgi:catechol 2,3-dioxygenase-like lactoylglutathione lyase family enzyme